MYEWKLLLKIWVKLSIQKTRKTIKIELIYLPNQSGSSEPARDSEYLLPEMDNKKEPT